MVTSIAPTDSHVSQKSALHAVGKIRKVGVPCRPRIVAINPGKPEKQQWREAVPEGKATLQAANVVNRQATDGPFQLHRKRPNRLAVGEVGLQNRPRG